MNLDTPTTKEELERKTVEHLEAMVNRHDAGRLQKRDLALIGRSLWFVTAGLVDESVTDLCSQVADASVGDRQIKRIFVGKGRLIAFRWVPDGPGYVINTFDLTTGLPAGTTVRGTDVGLREAEMDKLIESLRRSGMYEI